MSEIADLRALIEGVKKDLESKVTNEKIDELIKKMEEKDKKILKLEERILDLERSKSLLERRVDDNESYTRRQNLRVFGIPNLSGRKETEEECVEKVMVAISHLEISNDVGIEIDRAHRIGAPKKDVNGKPLAQPIIVRFTSWKARTTVYRNRVKKGDVRFYIDLTKRRFLLKKTAMELVKDNDKVLYVFADVNNNICLRLKDNTVRFFNSEVELKSILNSM